MTVCQAIRRVFDQFAAHLCHLPYCLFLLFPAIQQAPSLTEFLEGSLQLQAITVDVGKVPSQSLQDGDSPLPYWRRFVEFSNTKQVGLLAVTGGQSALVLGSLWICGNEFSGHLCRLTNQPKSLFVLWDLRG